MSRISNLLHLLRTRVEIEQQQSSQALLGAMNRRQGLQLKLQAALAGLSVAAITYCIVGLGSYLAKGAQALGWPVGAESTAAAAIPVVASGVWWSLRRLHRRVHSAGALRPLRNRIGVGDRKRQPAPAPPPCEVVPSRTWFSRAPSANAYSRG